MLRETEEILQLLDQLLSPPKLGPHVHKCGFDLDNPGRAGCGHEWTHDGRESQRIAQDVFDRTGDNEASHRVYDEQHACPKCGRGPWKTQVNPITRARYEQKAA